MEPAMKVVQKFYQETYCIYFYLFAFALFKCNSFKNIGF